MPRLTGRVVDDAGILSKKERGELVAQLAGLEARTGHRFVIVTTPGLRGETIAHFGIRLGRTWGVGRKDADDGVLLIVAPTERKVRIEVGYGLEKRLSDPVCAKIIRDTILPRFRAGDMAGGIRAGTLAVIERLGGR